jgi:uncharacterized membrane protein
MSRVKTLVLWGLAAIMTQGGIMHFVATRFYVRIMPPGIPAPEAIVYLSGVIESGLGLALLPARTRRWAAWGLVATLIAIFPANIYGATSAGTDHPAMPGVPVWAAWLRLPLQLPLIAAAYWFTQDER